MFYNQIVTKEYIHGGLYIDEVITVTNTTATYFYLHDLRFSIYALIDNQGNVVERARYEGYGKYERLDASFNPITTPIIDQPYTHTGQRFDRETNLQYFRLRYYDAHLGRFISRDPIGYVDGMSLYRGYFVVNELDPFGLESSCTGSLVDDPSVEVTGLRLAGGGRGEGYRWRTDFAITGMSNLQVKFQIDIKICVKVKCRCLESTNYIKSDCGKFYYEERTYISKPKMLCIEVSNIPVWSNSFRYF